MRRHLETPEPETVHAQQRPRLENAPSTLVPAAAALQRSAGNRATTSLIQRQRSIAGAADYEESRTPVLARIPSTAAGPVIQRAVLPPGAQVVATPQTTISAAPVLAELNRLARSLWPIKVGSPDDFATTQVGNDIVEVMETGNMAKRAVAINYTQTTGKNMIWTGNVFFRLGPPRLAASGSGQLTSGGGGTGSAQSTTNSSATGTLSGEGSAGGHEGAAGGKVSAGTSHNGLKLSADGHRTIYGERRDDGRPPAIHIPAVRNHSPSLRTRSWRLRLFQSLRLGHVCRGSTERPLESQRGSCLRRANLPSDVRVCHASAVVLA